jgi:His/Glu/Gln/Arg/opine family amino acid ABC transporter permease subunit
MIQDLRLKRLFGVIVGEAEAQKIVHLDTRLQYIPLPWLDDKAIAFKKNSPRLSAVNNAIETLIENGERDRIVEKWLGENKTELSPKKLHFERIFPSFGYLLKGFILNLRYVFCALSLGLCLGILLTAGRLSHSRILKGLSSFYISLFRGTPLLLQLSLVYYAWPQLVHFRLTAFQAGVMAFSLNSGAYISEILRSGFNGVPIGQWEAAQVLGLPKWRTWKDIVLPQAVRNSLPALGNEMIDLLKESALVSTIGEADLLCRANQLASEHYLFFEPLIVAAVCYYVAIVILGIGVQTLEKRMRPYVGH